MTCVSRTSISTFWTRKTLCNSIHLCIRICISLFQAIARKTGSFAADVLFATYSACRIVHFNSLSRTISICSTSSRLRLPNSTNSGPGRATNFYKVCFHPSGTTVKPDNLMDSWLTASARWLEEQDFGSFESKMVSDTTTLDVQKAKAYVVLNCQFIYGSNNQANTVSSALAKLLSK